MKFSNFESGVNQREQLTLPAAFLLWHIMYFHNLTLANVLTLWASLYVLIMGQHLEIQQFVLLTTLWNHIQQLHYITNALETDKFHPFIRKQTQHGFLSYNYSFLDDS